ncbi:MAG TPA: ABC transporter ATP-binding protein [Gemmataceae bacterium]|nr:ABC transporter ATP-binding protein [Gemmataceae bacterium]
MVATATIPETLQFAVRSPQSGVAVECRGVTKQFGTGDTKVMALRGVDMTAAYGEMTLLVGPSGCGKTTLISVICGLLDATEGTVVVLDEELTAMGGRGKTAFRRTNVGFVFQQYNLLPALTAAENAAVPLIVAGWPRVKAVNRANEVLDAVGLADKLRTYPDQLSGGQQQRVAIARALVHEPRLLVCDEPTAALDARSGQTVMELLKDIGRRPDRAVIIVTHDNRVFRFGDRIVTMSDGRIESVEENNAT